MMSSRQNRKSFFRYAVAVIATVGVLSLLVQLVPGGRDAAHRVALPLWQVSSVGESAWGNVVTAFRSKAVLERENNQLADEIKRLQLRTLELPILEEENKRLAELWGRRSFEHSVLAKVLSWPNASVYDTLVVDVGEQQGVTVGNVAMVEGVSVGRVASVFSRTAVVELFSTPGVLETVLIGEARVPVEARGRGGGNFVAEVPRDVAVMEGDIILYPDTRSRVFATVASVQAKAADPFRTVLFRLPVNLFEIDFVEIVREGSRPLPSAEEEESLEEDHE